MKTIGTDASLKECKNSGYMMMQYDARKKFNPETYYRLFQYYPQDYTRDIKDEPQLKNAIILDVEYTWFDLVELYERHKIGVDSFAETNLHVNFENPDYFDFLILADELSAYCGLE